LKSLALLFHYLLLNMFRMLVYPSSGACDYCGFIACVVLFWFDVCWCYGVVRLEWCGITHQSNTTTEITTNKSQASEDGCINIRNMLSSK